MNKEDFQSIVQEIPRRPGIYRFVDKKDTAIYIGKAKNLRNRLSSYFVSPDALPNKTRVMVRHADHIEYTVVETDHDAYLLENTLIKKHQPRYNIMLKDGKSYTYICIKKEPFPRVFQTRTVVRDGSTYFGPYYSKWRTSILISLIKDLFPLRTCNLNLSPGNISQKKYKVCLEYHLGNCHGPCENLEQADTYNQRIQQIKNILRGNLKPVRDHLLSLIAEQAELLEYEKANVLKEKLIAFDDYQSKSSIVNPTIKDVDVVGLEIQEDYAYYNFLKIANGNLVNSHSDEVELKTEISEQELLEKLVPELREKFHSVSPEVILQTHIDIHTKEYTIVVPKIGDKKKLLDLSLKNLMYHRIQHQRALMNKQNFKTHSERILRTMQKDLQMDTPPFHIECFDNSNFHGSNPVASCVVFKNAKPSKADYRHYHIKTVVGPDDFASMNEVVGRRYSRMIEETGKMPDLIIIDGGKGQLSAAVNILKTIGVLEQTTIIGIAKKLEEIYFPGDSVPLYINKKSETLKVIQQARNEAHRFAITFHRDLRSKRVHKTILTDIPGIGEKTSTKLLQFFKSVERIKEASLDEIESIVGPAVAKKVYQYFRKEQ